MISIIDCGMGNLRSVQKAFVHLGHAARITSDADGIRKSDKVVLPGDGAFGDEMKNLKSTNLESVLREIIGRGTPFLGICVGQQVLFQESEEFGFHEGLGLFQGRIKRLPATLPVPHMGWNQLHIRKPSRLLDGVDPDSFVYFIHSYYIAESDPTTVSATTDYDFEFPVVVERENIFSTQFHPEKSQKPGLQILKNFASL